MANAEEMNAFAIGEDNARHVGVNVKRVKLVVMISISALIGVSVSIGGTIGFVGLVIPHITRMLVGPKEAPDETPIVDPSAKGFLNNPCIAAPQRERATPTRATHITLGSLTKRIIEPEIPSGSGLLRTVFAITVKVSTGLIFTLPTVTQKMKTTRVIKLKKIYSLMLNTVFLCKIIILSLL